MLLIVALQKRLCDAHGSNLLFKRGISDHGLRERLAPDSEGVLREEQMVAVIREADREPVSVVTKRHRISEQTIYTWRKRFGGFHANDTGA